ncbi:MAG: ferritin-like domain-containing protein [Planctomycetes bacterium]|nr:ferritin-like domain-containing protein [Planctomycetota bacterium]
MHTTSNLRLSFDRFFAATERHRWELETDIPWAEVRPDLVTQDEVRVLRGSALVESFAPGYGADLLTTFAADVAMSSFLTIQLYEEFKHFHALRRYLHCLGIEVTDAEITQGRAERVAYDDPLVPLLKFGISEVFTAVAYREIARHTREPVLQKLSTCISDDEYRHLGWYVSYLEGYVNEHGIGAAEVNAALEHYQHQGLDAIGSEWVEHWNFVGERYTRLEPYRYLKRMLRGLVGSGVKLQNMGRRTSNFTGAQTFR